MALQSEYISVISSSIKEFSFWIYLVNWVLALILSLAFIFYFHRLVGVVVSFILRLTLWKSSKVQVNIESIKLSPLGGRIFLKNLTITTADMTISVLFLTWTWRYWLLQSTRLSSYLFSGKDDEEEIDAEVKNQKLHTRFLCVIEGLEIFMYNRTVAYDNIMEILNNSSNRNSRNCEENSDSTSTTLSEDLKGNLRFRTNANVNNNNSSNSNSPSSNNNRTTGTAYETSSPNEDDSDNSISYLLTIFLQLFPVKLKIKKGALVMGNATTPSILVGSYKLADGMIDITRSPNQADFYRYLYNFMFDNFQLWMRPNISYDKYKYGGETERSPPPYQSELTKMKRYKMWYKFQRASISVKNKFNKLIGIKSTKPIMETTGESFDWQGLKRYIGDTDGDQEILRILNPDEQYAKYSLVLDSLSTTIVYYYDIPGIQQSDTSMKPPEHGIEVEISMGTIHYGPWTDRQRVPLQNMFFPPISRDSVPTVGFLAPGNKREYSGFQVTVVVKDEVIIRIPTREPSKDKEIIKMTGLAPEKTSSRSFGWLEIKMREGSNISSFTSYVANSEEGWPNRLNAIFNEVEIRSSVNHDVLFLADSHEINAKIGFPLAWNGKCEWDFEQTSFNGRLFFLREHTLLFSDLFIDFASGDPQPYELFRAFLYNITWKITNYKLYLNVNDFNIINNALDFNNNKYLSFQGPEITCDIAIPLYGIFSKSTTISFEINTPHFDLILDTPSWHTANNFMQESNVVGRSNQFKIDGSYTFFSSVEVNTSNYIEIRCIGDEVSLKFYGFVIRYLFAIRENYFGDFIHFKTFEEYTSTNAEDESITDTVTKKDQTDESYWKMIKTETDVDVLFTFQVRSGLILLPYYLYSCQSHIGLSFDMLDVDMRFCNYYMDMQADFSPISAVFVENYNRGKDDPLLSVGEYLALYLSSNIDMTVDGFSIHTHRMFGVPPEELTFYCKWDFSCGDWIVDSTPMFMRSVVTGISNFLVGFKDFENALEPNMPSVYDTANFSFRCPKFGFKLTPSDCNSYLDIELNDFLLSFNDISNRRYTNKLVVRITEILVRVMEQEENKILAQITTSLVFSNICQKVSMVERRMLQQLHARNNDAPFHRAPFVLLEEYKDDFYNKQKGCFLTALTLPVASIPLNESTVRESKRSHLDIEPHSDSENSSQYMEENLFFSGKIPPTNDYIDEEYTPSYPVDPDTEYDNYMVELGDAQVFISPKAVELVGQVAKDMTDFSLDKVMDQFDVATVKMLNSLIKSVKSVKNFRVVNHIIDLTFGNFEMNEKFKPTIKLQILGLSMAISDRTESLVHVGKKSTLEETTLAVHVKEISSSVTKPSQTQDALLLNIQEIEVWLEKKQEGMIGSGNFETIVFDIDDAQVAWLIEYLQEISEKVCRSADAFGNLGTKDAAYANLVHILSLASNEYRIDHDPDVLTRPAYILRAKKEHIRFFDCWKIIARSRHLLQSLPYEWYQEHNARFKEQQWDLPSNAFEQVLDIFSKWRMWEANEEERLDFFKRIFSQIKENDPGTESHFQIVISEILIRLASSVDQGFLELKRLSTSIGVNVEQENKDIEMVFNLDDYKGKLTGNALNLLKLCHTKEKPVHEEKKTAEDTKLNVSGVISIGSFHQGVLLPSTTLELHGNELFSRFESTSLYSISTAFNLDLLELNIFNSSTNIFNICLNDLGWILAKSHDDVVDINFDLGELTLEVLDKQGDLPSILSRIVNEDVGYVRELVDSFDQGVIQDKTEKSEHLHMYMSVNVRVNKFNYTLEPLNPFLISGSIFGIEFGFNRICESILFITDLKKYNCNVHFYRSNILELNGSDLRNFIEVATLNDLTLITSNLSVANTRIFAPNLLYTIDMVLKQVDGLEKKIETIREIFNNIDSKEEKSVTPAPTKKNYLFKAKLANDYVGLSTFVNHSKVSFEVESTTMGVSNVAKTTDEEENFNEVPLYGEFSIPTARFSITDRYIPIGLSNLIDVNIVVRLLNDGGKSGQTLQIESQYCRICLSEPVIFRLVTIVEEVDKVIPKTTPNKQVETSSTNIADVIYSRVSMIQFLSYSFCLGWLFSDTSKESSKDYPGVIIGAERFFAAMDQDIGKFTLMEAYFSVAHGSRSSNYYTTQSEKANLNRAFLPTIQLVYTIEKQSEAKNARISMHGDELDVKFLSNSVVIVERLAESGANVQKFFEHRNRNSKREKEVKVSDATLSYTDYDSIEFVSTFAGSTVLFYRLENEDTTDSPSLFLESPAVKMAFKYSRNQNTAKRSFKGEVFTSSSDNILYPNCVPVVVDLITGVKSFMKKPSKEVSTEKTIEEDKGSEFIQRALEETDIHVRLRFEKQALSLSCEPTAKVAAIVGIEGMFIQLNTNEGTVPGATLNVLLDNISASLQHIYSREISASAGIQGAILSSVFEFAEVERMLSSGALTDVDGYINVKQYQDVELFRDIWFPPELFSEFVTEEEQVESLGIPTLASNKSISSGFKQVSTTYAFPWVLTFLISNANLRVDFGQSLGNFKLKVDNFWAISKKSSDWAQDLKTGIHEITLISEEGRLGGNLMVENINLHTAICWKLDSGVTLDVPLILVSGGVERLHLKTSFDYHVIAIANLQCFSMDIYNRKSEYSLSKDHLFVATKFENAQIYITTLTPSNVLDIQNAIRRMVHENRRSYKETLRDSSNGKNIDRAKMLESRASQNLLDTVKKLETKIYVSAGKVLIHIYPASFENSKVLSIQLDESTAKFQQNQYTSGISNELDIKFNDLKVSLANIDPVGEEFVNNCSVSEFVQRGDTASGGTIFVFPSFKVSMRTFQKGKLIEYLFQSTFDGTVDIRWNLGSVNFIREMYSIYNRALSSRIDYRKRMESFDDKIEEKLTRKSKQEANQDIDDAIRETFEKVETSSKYQYVALAPPIIEAPQIKELGNATPPLEWFGLHRNKFPNVTHQLGIVALQKLVQEIEIQYSKMLGKA
ncbi:Protein CSF1 [Spathaspora sp. JA1]|nr:Protein CSF1 [Spathaspora sp. JA1]